MNVNDSAACFDLDGDEPRRRRHLVFTSVFSLCAVIGVLGNLMVLVVYRRERSCAWPAVYVQALAVVDMLVCGVVVPYTIVAELRQVTDDVACRVLELTRHTLVIFSFYILSAVAVERYLAVFRPVRGRTTRKTKMVVAGIFVASAAIALPCVFTFSVTPVSTEEGRNRNASEVIPRMTSCQEKFCQFTMEIIGQRSVRAYHGALAFQHVLTIAIMISLYVRVYFEIWRREHRKIKVRPWTKSDGSVGATKGVLAIRSKPIWLLPLPAVSTPGKTPAANTAREATLQLQITSLASDHQKDALPQLVKTTGKKAVFLTTAVHKEPLDEDTQTLDNERKITGQHSDADEQNICNPDTGSSDQGTATNNNNLFKINAISCSAQEATRRRQERRRKAGTMMAVCTLLHVVLWLPFWLDLFNLTSSVILRFTFLFSHATNPIVYGVVNDKMRQGLKKVLLCK